MYECVKMNETSDKTYDVERNPCNEELTIRYN